MNKRFKQENIEGQNVTIYDNGGRSLDRITVVFNDQIETENRFGTLYNCLSASLTGLGCYMWSVAQRGRHLGKIIPFSDLDLGLQESIIYTCKDIAHENKQRG